MSVSRSAPSASIALALCLSVSAVVSAAAEAQGSAEPSLATSSQPVGGDATDPAAAQELAEAAVAAEEIVVTASRLPESAVRAPAATAILDAAALEAFGSRAVAESLRFLPAVAILQSGGPGRVSGVQIRGASTSHSLILLDGQRLNDPTTGGFDIADLRGLELARVEVVRGPQSAVWGSEAMGGVVNLVTRPVGPGWSGRLGLGAGEGSLSSWGAAFGYGGDRGGLRTAVDGEEGRLLSTAAARAGNPELDAHRVAQLGLRGDLELSSSWHLEASARGIDSAVDLDGFAFGIGPVDDPNYRQDRRLVAVSASLLAAGEHLSSTVRVGSVEERLRGEDPDTPFNPYAIDTSTRSASYQGDLDLGLGLLTGGAAWEQREGVNVGAFDERVELRSGFLQQRLEWRDCTVSLGGRHDDHEVAGGATSARLGASCALSDLAVVRGAWGEGFRAPAFNELAFPFYGNPELRPESSTAAELAVVLSGRGRSLELVAFRQRYRDLIGTGPDFTAANVDRAAVDGAELRAQLRGDGFAVELTTTYLDTEDQRTGSRLPNRAQLQGSLYATIELPASLAARVGVVAVGDRLDSSGAEVAGYERVDAALAWSPRPSLEVVLVVGNLLDEAYHELAGYGTTGRLARVAATWRF